jgi:hypothetical protein
MITYLIKIIEKKDIYLVLNYATLISINFTIIGN